MVAARAGGNKTIACSNPEENQMSDQDLTDGNKATVQHLKSIPGLENFTEADLAELLKFSRIETYHENDLIKVEKTRDDRVFYLIAGKVKLVKNGREIVVLRRTGDVFGEISVIAGVDRAASVYAVGPTTCLAINLSHLDMMNETNRLTFKYLLYRSFAEIMANRLKMTTDELMQVKEKLEKYEAR